MQSFLGVAWENVLVGLLGGVGTSGLFLLLRRLRELSLQRRFPVSGDYITKFEDRQAGVAIVSTAPATLRQRGLRIRGVTVLEGRTWLLQGELSPSGYIHGLYFAEDPVDKGLGNFFLRIHNDRSMEGLWSGFDSTNDTITSGRYTFAPVRQAVTVRPGTSDDLLSVLHIADEQLGQGYVSEEFFREADTSDRSFIKVAKVHGRIVGFAIVLVQSPVEIAALMRVALPRHLSLAERVGLIKTVAVAPSMHGRGIGTRLAQDCLSELGARHVKAICSVAWQRAETVNIRGVLERQGFLAFATVPDYWRDSSLSESFGCPECGDPPCRCTAVMYSQVI